MDNMLPFSSDENQLRLESDILSVFRKGKEPQGEIKEGMSAVEIAEIVSDHLIKIVREDFENQAKAKK